MSYLGKSLLATQDCISFFLRLSLLVKDCQNPRDPLQPASKKKTPARMEGAMMAANPMIKIEIDYFFIFFSSLAERAITAVPVTALP